MSTPKGKAPTAATVEASDVETLVQKESNVTNSTPLNNSGATALIPVFNGTMADAPVQLCDARTLHTFLQVKRDFTTWIKARIRKFGFVLGLDFITITNLSSPNLGSAKARAQKLADYHLTLDMAKELSMVENNDQGRAARRYFIECERVAHAAVSKASFAVKPTDKLSAEQQGVLRDLLTTHAKRLPIQKQGAAMVQGWSKLKSHFGVSYRDIPASEFTEAVSIISRHVTEWELVDELPYKREETLNELVARLAYQLDQPNGYLVHTFLPLWIVINKRMMKFMRVDPETGLHLAMAH